MVIFKNKYGEFRSGWAIVLSLVIMYVSQIAAALVQMVIMIVMYGMDEYPYWTVSVGVSSTMTIIVYLFEIAAAMLLFYLIYKRPIRQMGFGKINWMKQLLLGGLYGLALMAIIVLILVLTGNAYITDVDFGRIITLEFIMGFLVYVCVGFYEEILCRGFMMTALKSTRNKWVIILLPSVIFGLLHMLNPNVTVFSIVNIVLVGIIFSYLMIKTGRIWASIGFHITWNFFQGNVFGIPVSGTEDFSLMETVFTGNTWITGGAFGAEGGAVCTLVLAAFLLFIHFVIKAPDDNGWSIDSDMPLLRGQQ